MRPTILVIEPRHEVAVALEDVLESANYGVMVKPHIERLDDLAIEPAAIIVRVAFEGSVPAHRAIERLQQPRPPVVAIACDDEEVAEAERMKCDAVVRAPKDVGQLCEVLRRVLQQV